MAKKVLYPLVVWIGMAGIAVINGIIRELILVPRVGDQLGHIVSTVFLAGVIRLITYLFFSWITVSYSNNQLLLMGVGWSVLTIGFEFIVGFLEGSPPSVVLAQYDVFSGSTWVIVPITLLVAPFVFGSITR